VVIQNINNKNTQRSIALWDKVAFKSLSTQPIKWLCKISTIDKNTGLRPCGISEESQKSPSMMRVGGLDGMVISKRGMSIDAEKWWVGCRLSSPLVERLVQLSVSRGVSQVEESVKESRLSCFNVFLMVGRHRGE